MIRRSCHLAMCSMSWLPKGSPTTFAQLGSEHKRIYQICLPEKAKYLTNGLITLLHSALFMYLPKIYGDINYLMELKISNMDQAALLTEYGFIFGKWSVVFGLMGLFTYWRRFDFLDISNRIAIRMRTVAFRKILDSDFYRSTLQHQTYLHHLITDIQTVSWFAGQTVFIGLRGLFFLLGGTVCLLFQSPLICLIAAVTMTGFNIFYRPRNLKLRTLKEEENQKLIELSEHISERLNNIRLIKICHTEALEEVRLSQRLSNFYQYASRVAKANGLNYASLESLGLFSLFSIAACGSLMISFELSNFSLITSSTYAFYVAMGFRSCIAFNTELMKIMGVYSILERKIGPLHLDPDYLKPYDQISRQYVQEMVAVEKQAHPPLKSTGIDICIKGLTFSYENPNSGKTNIMYKNFNLHVAAGSIVALVGPSGSGKSTLLNIITKLCQPNSGSIQLDEMPLSLMNFSDIQQTTSYVTQETFLFRGTVRDNLIYGNQGFDSSDDHLLHCLKMTNIHSFVEMHGGLDMMIEERGKNLSGGEKQRIALARALVKNPRLLLLDEATSGIDGESEKVIIANLRESRKGMTTLIVTHKVQNFSPILTHTIDLTPPSTSPNN